MAGHPLLGQVRHDLPDHAHELEAVPGTRRGERHLLVLRVNVDDEVVVWGVGEHAGGEAHRRPGSVREVTLSKLPEELLVVVMGLTVDLVGLTRLFQVEILTELEARYPEDGEAVEASLRPPAG